MSENTTAKPHTSFWIIAGVALVWNLLGVMAFLMQVGMSVEDLAALPEAERALYENSASWAVIAFAIAVFGGALGCVLLLLRKYLAMPVFVLSLLGVLAQNYHAFFMIDSMAVYGSASVAMPILVIIIACFLIWYSMSCKKKGWIS